MKYEMDCLNVLNDLEKNGYKISLPVIRKNNQMEFCKWSFKEPLVLNKFGTFVGSVLNILGSTSTISFSGSQPVNKTPAITNPFI